MIDGGTNRSDARNDYDDDDAKSDDNNVEASLE